MNVGNPAQQQEIADLFAMQVLQKGYDVIDRANLAALSQEAEFQNESGITSPEGRAKLAIHNVSAVIVVNVAAPYAYQVPPSSQSYWVRGHWYWSGPGYVWVPGHWEVRERPGYMAESGEDISMTAKMVDVQTGTLLWAGEGTGSLKSGLSTLGGALLGAGAGVALGFGRRQYPRGGHRRSRRRAGRRRGRRGPAAGPGSTDAVRHRENVPRPSRAADVASRCSGAHRRGRARACRRQPLRRPIAQTPPASEPAAAPTALGTDMAAVRQRRRSHRDDVSAEDPEMERQRDDLPGGRFHPVRRGRAGVRRGDSQRRRRTGPGRPRRDAPGFPDHRPRVRRRVGHGCRDSPGTQPNSCRRARKQSPSTNWGQASPFRRPWQRKLRRRAASAGPRILFTTTPTILVLVDGEPVLRPMADLNVERVVNTRALIVKAGGRFYLTAMNFWYEAPAIEGPWVMIDNPPALLEKAREAAVAAKMVDLMQPQPGAAPLKTPPAVRVSTVPTELIETDGPPQLLPVEDTSLLQVKNTDDVIFLDLKTNRYYVLLVEPLVRVEIALWPVGRCRSRGPAGGPCARCRLRL